MTTTSIDLSRLYDPRVANHVEGVDGRIRAGFRLALDVLGVPLPDYAERIPMRK